MNIKNFTLTGVFVSLVTVAAAQERLSDGTDKSGLTMNQNAILELASRNKGLLHTRIALEMTTKAAPMKDHVAGLMVFNTETRNDVVPGIYYNDGTKWVLASSGKATSISYDPSTYEISFIDINSNPVTLNFKNIIKGNETVTSLIDNGNGTYVYTSESGLKTTIDVAADVSNTFEQIVKNENVKNEIISLIKKVGRNVYYDGTKITYLTKEGDTKEISIKEIVSANETLTVLGYDKSSNQLKYTDEKGQPHVFDLGTGYLEYKKESNSLTYIDAKGVSKELALNATKLNYDAVKNELQYTNSKGLTETIGLSALVKSNETVTVLGYDKPSNQLKYTDEKGQPHVFDLGTGSLEYKKESNSLTYIDAKGVSKELALNITGLRYDAESNSLQYTNSKGLTETIGLSALVKSNETLTVLGYDKPSNQLKYTDEKGQPHVFDLGTGSLEYKKESNSLTYIDAKGVSKELALNTTNLRFDTENNALQYTNSKGLTETIGLTALVKSNETVTVLGYDKPTNQLTYKDEKGIAKTVDLGTGELTYDGSKNMLTYIDAKGVAKELTLNTTNLRYDASSSALLYTNTNGITETIGLAVLVKSNETVTVLDYDKTKNQLSYTDEKGVANILDLGTGSLEYTKESNSLTYIDGKGVSKELILNTTNLRYDAESNALEYTNSKGLTETIGLVAVVKSNETLTVLGYDKTKNQLSYTDEKGVANILDLGTGSLEYKKESNSLTYIDSKGVSKELILNTTNLRYDAESNALQYTDSKGLTETIGLAALVKSNETLTSLNQDATGIEYRDESNNTHNAKVVSANTTNIIKVDGDFGALLIAEDIHANQEKTTVSGGKGTVVTLEENNNTKNYKVEVTDDLIKILKSAMPKFFYMPSMVMPTFKDQISDKDVMEENGGVFTIKLYESYKKQFGLTDQSSSAVNAGKVTTLPVLPANELDYYVTFYDKTVFEEVSISNEGVLTYRIKQDADITIGSFMNIVFAVRP